MQGLDRNRSTAHRMTPVVAIRRKPRGDNDGRLADAKALHRLA
jgi:hypothetical protein